jgi:ketosteroid isomerase-like protein
MDNTYQINLAKTEFREGYNQGDVDRILRVFDEEGFTDMSEGGASSYGEASLEALSQRSKELFAKYAVTLAVIIIEIVILGDTAYDYGWHEFILNPRDGGDIIRKRERYFELWRKNSSGHWKISLLINNADVREQMAGQVSHWFLSESRQATAS